MALITWARSGPPLTDADTERVERLVGSALLEEYAAFLRVHSGGVPSPAGFTYCHATLGLMDAWVDVIFPVMQTEGGRVTLEWMIGTVRARVRGQGLYPADAVAIGDGAGGSILLFVRGLRAGQVWYKVWHDFGCEELDRPMAGMGQLAPTFNAFLDGLHEPVIR
jgi:hypothetical protein